jgi:hypothetical protein
LSLLKINVYFCACCLFNSQVGRCLVAGAAGFLLAAAWALFVAAAAAVTPFAALGAAPFADLAGSPVPPSGAVVRRFAGPLRLWLAHSAVCVAMFALERVMVQPASTDDAAAKV